MTQLRHEQVTVDGASIHAVTAGPAGAPALLLLHGWPESWATWRELIPLAARSHRVVAIDLPGVGGSSGGAPGAKAAIARAVHGLAGALELVDITLVGHDIGGMVTYAYLREFTDLARAVIMDVPIPGVDPWDDFVRAPFLWHFALHAVPRLPELLVPGREADYLGYFNRESASSGPTGTPLLYLRGGAERGGPIGPFIDGLSRAGVTDVRSAVIDMSQTAR